MKFIKLSIVLFSLILSQAAVTSPSIAGKGSEALISVNFVDVEIPTVIKFISEITGKNFLFDERIKGKITIIAPTKLSINEAFNLFTSVLSLKGYTIIPAGPKTYKIIPSSLAKQSGKITPEEAAPVNEGYITKLIPVDYIQATEALQFLRPVISRDGHISAFGPHNMLLVVDSAINIEKIISILKRIDKPSAMEEEAEIHVYFVEHADATDLAKVIQGLVKDIQTSYKTARRTKKEGAAASVPILSVTPDIATNSLVIVAPPTDYRNIMQIIKTLDKKRKQVFVEAMIIEASIDNLQELGTKWRATATHNGDPIAIGGFGNVSPSTIVDIITGLSGLSVGGMGNFLDIPVTAIGGDGSASSQTLTAPGFAAIFSLEEFKDSINVLSTPQVLTSDNEEAEILVGENVPFISQRERDVVTTNTVLNSIQRTDVGIKLNIKPQITEGDYVKLDIFQEISAVEDASDEVITTVGPTTTKRATKTSVVVKDGRTVVIGGLMQEKEEVSVNKVPILGDIPVMEWLFKFRRVSKNKTNLLVFLSPHIVKENLDTLDVTEDKHKAYVKKENNYKQDELLVKFKEDVSKERALEIILEMGAAIIKHFESINVYHIRLAPGQNVEDALQEFLSRNEVLYAEPNYKVTIPEPPEGTHNERAIPVPDMETEKLQSFQVANLKDPALVIQAGPSLSPDSEYKKPSPADLDKKKTYSSADVKDKHNTVEQIKPAAARDTENIQDTPPDISELLQTLAKDEIATEYTKSEKIENEEIAPEMQSRKASGSRLYYIQIGAWKNIRYAVETLDKLKAQYPDIYMTEHGTFNIVRIPGTMSKKKDMLILKELKEKYNLKPILVNKKI
jgi:general secretion pathway protein D